MTPEQQKNCIVPLNLPPRTLPLTQTARGTVTVFDPLRRKSVVLTPEEWVRQHFVAYLVADLGYPAGLIGNEVSLNLNGLHRRCDSIVWRQSDATPLMIIEYKAPRVRITSKVFDQITRYNMVFQAPYLIVTNGLAHHCCKVDLKSGTYEFLPAIPPYSSL